MTEHTPLPWRVDEDDESVINGPDYGTIAYVIRHKEASAAYIVQACNACPRLHDVLRELVEAVDEQKDGLDPTVRLVQAMRDAKSWVET